jgi:hypothetical protein
MFYDAIITFGVTNPISITDAALGILTLPANSLVWKIFIEPLRANTHAAWVGGSNVTKNGTGVAVQELAAPAAGVPLDRFDLVTNNDRGVDPSAYYVHGTHLEQVKVMVWTV